jgi:hypothetical protein
VTSDRSGRRRWSWLRDSLVIAAASACSQAPSLLPVTQNVEPSPTAAQASDDDTHFIPVAPPADAVSPVAREDELDESGLLLRTAWPPSIAEAVDWNLRHLSTADLALVQHTPRRDLVEFYHGWGTYLRNNFGLWRGNRRLMDACGNILPDDCSMKIIEATWERLQRPTP